MLFRVGSWNISCRLIINVGLSLMYPPYEQIARIAPSTPLRFLALSLQQDAQDKDARRLDLVALPRYAAYSFAYRSAYRFCVPAYRSCAPIDHAWLSPDCSLSDAVLRAYFTEAQCPGSVSRLDALPVRFCHCSIPVVKAIKKATRRWPCTTSKMNSSA